MSSNYVLKKELQDAMREVFDRLRFDELFVTCLSCQYWDHKGDQCGKYQQKPPAKVIVAGCPAFEATKPWTGGKAYDDEIPF